MMTGRVWSSVWNRWARGTLKACKLCLMWLAALSTVTLFVLAFRTYLEHGVVHPCPENLYDLSEPWHHHRLITLSLVQVLITLLSVVVMEFYSVSAHLQLSSWLGLAQWHWQVALLALQLGECGLYGRVSLASLSAWLALVVGLMIGMYAKVAAERWQSLAFAAGGGHQAKAWKRLLRLVLGWALLLVLLTCAVPLALLPPQVPFAVFAPSPFVVLGLFLRLAWPSLRLITGAKHAASRAALPGRAERIRWAASSVLLQFLGTFAAGGSSCACLFMNFWVASEQVRPEHLGDHPFYDVVNILYVLCNIFLLFSLEGIFSGTGRHARLRSRAARARQARWRRNWESWQRSPSASHSHSLECPEPLHLQLQWDEKVRELAGRGVSLDALLQFYCQTLPGVMPHFDPQRHTTGNVVFDAVIPYTSQLGCAAAHLMMAGQYALPQKMVTHNWRNKFSDLIAAIVSDAIGESDFGMVAWLLVHEPDKLKAWIADLEVGSRTYWICAFAVNQHISICGARGMDCSCNRQKFLNDSPPLMPDGSSIPCEVNKFDSMMKYLSANNPAFEQLVAVDAKCDLFWRAWCVAEIATAHETGMPQTLKVTSPDCLEANLGKLGQLKIEDMDASRKEDKDLILSRIESPEDFNKTLRHVLLREVIPTWSSLDAAEQMSLAGCIIRWQRLSQRMGDPTVWSV